MIIGAHSILYSAKPEADRAFLRDVLRLTNVDVGEGWLVFGLPPSEVAVHPAEESGAQEFYLMCADVGAFVAEMGKHGIACSPVQNQGWGLLTRMTLPGGGAVGVYQPRHARPKPMSAGKSKRKAAAASRRPRAARPARRKPSRSRK
ncbi:MAG TPA: extradiol dioxygenase [Thermoanaerobaculia bacterium]|nr:extradiol dioxygenase [Thermoanaerobaculia bacterium]